jgi:glycosyltransferase involved in cell wall biosynthesis
MKRAAIIIPAFNESENIRDVVSSIHEISCAYELVPIVVNDCSLDNTGEIIDELDCVALQLSINLGIGGAVQTGYKYAFNNGFDFAIQFDGDGQHPAESIPNLIESCESGNDVVIGSRYISKEGFQSTYLRRLGINYFKILNKILIKLTITDNTSGFRLLNRKALSLVNDYYPDDYPEPEAVVLYAKSGLKVVEIPVLMKERTGGVSSISASDSVYYIIKVTLAIVFTYFRTKNNNA